jgi:hypothetical protein
MAQKNYKFLAPNYNDQEKKCRSFLENFEDQNLEEHPIHGHKKYMIQLVHFHFFFLLKLFIKSKKLPMV